MVCLLTGCTPSKRAEEKDGPEDGRIRIDVLEYSKRKSPVLDFPSTTGLIFPEGFLREGPAGRLVDDRGRSIPFESEVTGWWDVDHSSIKWVLLHFRASENRTYYFEPGRKAKRFDGDALGGQTPDAVEVDTGPLRVRLSMDQPRLFESVKLHGQEQVDPDAAEFTLTADDTKEQIPGRLLDWKAGLEESTAARATVKASGMFKYPDGRPMARLDLRYCFYRGESFVRLYHTLTWMIKDTRVGARDVSLSMKPVRSKTSEVYIGLTEGDTPLRINKDHFSLHQDRADHFTAQSGDLVIREGKQIGGWVYLGDAAGMGISVSLRHAWQTHPTSFSLNEGRLSLQFWPKGGPRLSFLPEDIMTPKIYRHHTWKRYPFSKEKGHFVNNYENSPGFLYTAEGAARTNEVVFGFHDGRTKRSPDQLNSVTQHPIVLRQDPKSAMKVPFMGFKIMPRQPEKYPNIERAVDWLGRLSMARWISETNYGLLRFGMVRWSKHGEYTYYRWMDNTQYDQQMIPWLLFMRGGGRNWFEEGEITSRYCMDMNVNHYNTRGSPTGYMATCGGALPFPNFAFTDWNMKGMKLHFLYYYWHLTGYRRAKDVMDEVIAGTKEFTRRQAKAKGPHQLVGGREMYNMNRFWALAYQETLDPEIAEFARASREVTVKREWKSEEKRFSGPVVYLYDGLVLQQRVFKDPALSRAMLDHLEHEMLPIETIGGIRSPSDTIGCQWAFEQTGDIRYAEAGWDVARGMADLVPDVDLATQNVPTYPYTYLGNSIIRLHLMPILAGVSLGDRLGLNTRRPRKLRNNFFTLQKPAKKGEPYTGVAFILAMMDGPLEVTALLRTGAATAEVSLTRPNGEQPSKAEISQEDGILHAKFALPKVTKGDSFRIEIHFPGGARYLIQTDAGLVYHLPPGQYHGNAPLSGGQSYTPMRFYCKTVADRADYINRIPRPYSIRDAMSDELLFRPSRFNTHQKPPPVGPNRMIVFTVRGCRASIEWQLSGTSPFVSPTLEQWFDPAENGWKDFRR